MGKKKLTLRERVQNGAIWLDRNYPGWADNVSIDRLSMEHCTECVLGQLFDDFYNVVENDWSRFYRPGQDKIMSQRTAVARGFMAPEDLPVGLDGDDYYKDLNAEWVSAIKSRQTGELV